MVHKQDLLDAGLLAGHAKFALQQLYYHREVEDGVQSIVRDAKTSSEDWDFDIKWPTMDKMAGPCDMPKPQELTSFVSRVAATVTRRSKPLEKSAASMLQVVAMGEEVFKEELATVPPTDDEQLAGALIRNMPDTVFKYLQREKTVMGSGLHIVRKVIQSRALDSLRGVKVSTQQVLKPKIPLHQSDLFPTLSTWEQNKDTLDLLKQSVSEVQMVEALEVMV